MSACRVAPAHIVELPAVVVNHGTASSRSSTEAHLSHRRAISRSLPVRSARGARVMLPAVSLTLLTMLAGRLHSPSHCSPFVVTCSCDSCDALLEK